MYIFFSHSIKVISLVPYSKQNKAIVWTTSKLILKFTLFIPVKDIIIPLIF